MTLSSADALYLKPNPTAFQVLVLAGSTLGVPGVEAATLAVPGAAPTADVPAPVVPEAPAALLLPVAGLALGLALLTRQRRRRAA